MTNSRSRSRSEWLAAANVAAAVAAAALAFAGLPLAAGAAAVLAAGLSAKSLLRFATLRRWSVRVTAVCEAVARGDFEARLTRLPAQPELRRMLDAINDLIDLSDAFVREAGASMQAVSCLLYTSPSPRDGLLSRMPSSA